MKQLTLIAVVLSTIVLAGCTLPLSSNTSQTTTKDDTMMAQDQNTIIQEQVDAEMQAEIITEADQTIVIENNEVGAPDTNTTQTETSITVGSYEEYSTAAVDSALAAGNKVVLFFHASRCPPCRALDADIKANPLPANTVVFKVDYDNSTDLKKQYGVTVQHTLVRIDTDKSMIEKNIGGMYTDLVNLF